eukprot:COSAG01_NODE_70169_length_259_cov_0.781250_1_plen_49_part_10
MLEPKGSTHCAAPSVWLGHTKHAWRAAPLRSVNVCAASPPSGSGSGPGS